MDPYKTIDRLLKLHNAKLVRQASNNIWELPNGFRLIMARTPSDHRAGKNSLSLLRRGLGLNQPKPEPIPSSPVLAKNEFRCQCYMVHIFPDGEIPICFECKRCGELVFTDTKENIR